MSRTRAFDRFRRTFRAALDSRAGDGRAARAGRGTPGAAQSEEGRATRREFLAAGGRATAGAAALSLLPLGRALAAPASPALSVGIVGAGLAGLACADRLSRQGIAATLFEARDRTGGRCFSLGGAFPGPVAFPGQVAERGGEFIDNLHKTMIAYAREFGLTLEDVEKAPGEVFYRFDGRMRDESEVVEEFRDLVDAMRDDLRRLSAEPSVFHHNEADAELDALSLREYLVTRGAGPLARAAIEEAYVAEYGREPEEQSCLNFLLFVHADRRSKFVPFGVFSDERYHVVEGNEGIARGIAGRIPGPILHGHRLVRVARTPAGRIELTFQAPETVVAAFDAVVLAVPFTTLRGVDLDAGLDLPPEKRNAIANLGYGTNAKTMVGFRGRPWAALGGNGASYSDLPDHQTTWETNFTRATEESAILTDYSGGLRGASLRPAKVEQQVSRFLADLDLVFPGAEAAAARDLGRYRAHLEHWPSDPNVRGSYTCYLPGQFTTIAGLEGLPAGNLFFAGEHANSFYVWQGFMEGALLSGIDAAEAILSARKSGSLP